MLPNVRNPENLTTKTLTNCSLKFCMPHLNALSFTPKTDRVRDIFSSANNSCLYNETVKLLKAGLKEFDVIEFIYVNLTMEAMGCRNTDVVIIIEGIRSPNPAFTLNRRNIPEKIEQIGNVHYFYFDIVREYNPGSWIGKLVLGDGVYFFSNPQRLPDDETGIILKFDLIPNATLDEGIIPIIYSSFTSSPPIVYP